jgi:hypothetical protein
MAPIRIRHTAMALALLAAGHASAQQAPSALPPPVPAVQGGWAKEAQHRSATDWARRYEADASDAGALFNQFQALRYAGLAEGSGTVPDQQQARLDRLAERMATAHANTFEHHLLEYHRAFPSPDAAYHLERARRLGSERTELLLPDLVDAVRRFDNGALRSAANAARKAGLVAPAADRYAQDLLLSVEPGAVLLLAGEMDGVAAVVRQQAYGTRRDLLLVDARLLVDPAYRLRVWSACKAKGNPPASATELYTALAHATDRPVYLSLAFGSAMAGVAPDQLFVTGLAARIGASGDTMARLAENWPRMAKDTSAGPLARNYLVPGALLLGHYRRMGDEAKASALEHELRTMAGRLGALPQLHAAGVLAH